MKIEIGCCIDLCEEKAMAELCSSGFDEPVLGAHLPEGWTSSGQAVQGPHPFFSLYFTCPRHSARREEKKDEQPALAPIPPMDKCVCGHYRAMHAGFDGGSESCSTSCLAAVSDTKRCGCDGFKLAAGEFDRTLKRMEAIDRVPPGRVGHCKSSPVSVRTLPLDLRCDYCEKPFSTQEHDGQSKKLEAYDPCYACGKGKLIEVVDPGVTVEEGKYQATAELPDGESEAENLARCSMEIIRGAARGKVVVITDPVEVAQAILDAPITTPHPDDGRAVDDGLDLPQGFADKQGDEAWIAIQKVVGGILQGAHRHQLQRGPPAVIDLRFTVPTSKGVSKTIRLQFEEPGSIEVDPPVDPQPDTEGTVRVNDMVCHTCKEVFTMSSHKEGDKCPACGEGKLVWTGYPITPDTDPSAEGFTGDPVGPELGPGAAFDYCKCGHFRGDHSTRGFCTASTGEGVAVCECEQFVLCPTCDGKGSHPDPAVNDPEMARRHEVGCFTCGDGPDQRTDAPGPEPDRYTCRYCGAVLDFIPIKTRPCVKCGGWFSDWTVPTKLPDGQDNPHADPDYQAGRVFGGMLQDVGEKAARAIVQTVEHLKGDTPAFESGGYRSNTPGNRVRLKQDPNLERGQKVLDGRWKGGIVADGRRTALISCPKCGLIATLSNHTIASDGSVAPSVVCPDGCGFHEYVVLDGWDPKPRTAP